MLGGGSIDNNLNHCKKHQLWLVATMQVLHYINKIPKSKSNTAILHVQHSEYTYVLIYVLIYLTSGGARQEQPMDQMWPSGPIKCPGLPQTNYYTSPLLL